MTNFVSFSASFQAVSLVPHGCILTLSSVQPLPSSTPHPAPLPSSSTCGPIYTLDTQKSPLKLRRPLQKETTVSMNPMKRGHSDLHEPRHIFFDSYK